MISKTKFFIYLYTELVLGIFFIFLAIQLLPIRGWEFTTIFCCVFATISIINTYRMAQTYRAVKQLQQKNENAIQQHTSLSNDFHSSHSKTEQNEQQKNE